MNLFSFMAQWPTFMPTPTLALDIGDLITIGLVLAAGLGSVVANSSEKQKKKKMGQGAGRSKSRRQAGDMNQGAEGSDSGGSPSMEELASRRREQLRELARRRREQLSGGSGSNDARGGETMPRPDNLTVQEAAQRERGRQAYAERAQVLRGGKQSGGIEERAQALRQAEQVRQQQETSRARNRQEQLEALRQRYRTRQGQTPQQPQPQQSPAQRQASAQQARSAQQTSAPAPRRMPLSPSALPPPSMQSIREQERSAIAAKAIENSEIGSGSSTSGSPVTGPKLSSLMEGSISWRDAIVLKEILDKPVGQRSTDDRGVWM